MNIKENSILDRVYPNRNSNIYLLEMFKIIKFRRENPLVYLPVCKRTQSYIYNEEHHIVPRAWFKINHTVVDNSKWNLIRLSFKEHLIIHILLKRYFKEVGDHKLAKASTKAIAALGLRKSKLLQVEKLSLSSVLNINIPLEIEYARVEAATYKCNIKSTLGKIIVTNSYGQAKYVFPNKIPNGFYPGSPLKGRPFSKEHCKNISKAAKRRKPRRGWKLSQEQKDHLSQVQKQRLKNHPLSEKARKQISKKNSGKQNGHCKLKGKVIFINNGQIQKLHDKTLPIPSGWKLGMLKMKRREAGKFRWIHNCLTKENKIIGIDEPLPEGFAEKMAQRT